MPVLERHSLVNTTAENLFAWHERAGAFERLAPPWQRTEVVERGEGLGVGSVTRLKVATPFGWRRWDATHVACEQGSMFEDVQTVGPFAKWKHRHRFIPSKEAERCQLVDRVEYELPGGWLGERIAGKWMEKQLGRAFSYRHEITRSDLDLWTRTRQGKRMRILIAGGSGFLGSRLKALCESQGHRVFILTRHPVSPGQIGWNPVKGNLEAAELEGFDAVINLGGENIASGRWTASRKSALWSSRVDATRLLVDTLSRCSNPPSVFVSASGVGFYGESGQEERCESDGLGEGFLSSLCGAWEGEAERAESFGARVSLLRTGVVLSGAGGALKLMAGPFKFGLGGRLGNGAHWFPWISLEDWLYAAYELTSNENASGPYNIVSPGIVTNAEFVARLAKYLRRPAFCHVPAKVLRMFLGEMADETLLVSQKARPGRLLDEIGFSFRYPNLEDALKMAL